jgi:replicative DNA helicase
MSLNNKYPAGPEIRDIRNKIHTIQHRQKWYAKKYKEAKEAIIILKEKLNQKVIQIRSNYIRG